MLTRVFILLLALTLALTSALSQQPAIPTQDTVRIGTTAVDIDVIVTDKTGRRITGLTSADFQVLDEGQPQAIDFFTAIEGSRVARQNPRPVAGGDLKTAAPVTPLVTPFSGRFVALVLDDLSLSHENLIRSRRALNEFVIGKLAPGDLVALVATGGSTASLQQFTNDRQRLLSAIDRIGSQGGLDRRRDPRFKLTAAEAVRINSGDDEVLEMAARRAASQSIANENTQGSLTLGAEPPRRPSDVPASSIKTQETSSQDMLRMQVRTQAQTRVRELAADARRTLRNLGAIFDAMADLPGRKIVVLLTESFSTLGGTSEDLSSDLTQLIEKARRSGVSLYGLDAAGLRTNTTTASEHITGAAMRAREIAGNSDFSDFENLLALRVLVDGTGGALFANTNDIASGMERAVDDASSYYVIGFRPARLDNKFHQLSVTVKGKPDLVVRTRRGYLAVNSETAKGTNTELIAVLTSPIPRLDLPVQVATNVVPRAGEQIVMAGFSVGRNYLTLPEASATDQNAAYEVLAWVFAFGKDQPVGAVHRTLAYDLNKEPEMRGRLQTNGFVFVPQPFTLPAGSYQIRVVVREKSTGAVGSAYEFFEVPDLKETKTTSLSSVVLTEAGQNGFTGRNSFKPGSQVDLRFVIYNLPKNSSALSQRIALVSAKGQSLMDSELPIVANPGQQLHPQGTRLTLPAARGKYAVIVKLREEKAKTDLERRVDLVIE
jgi:VWFA-related protein